MEFEEFKPKKTNYELYREPTYSTYKEEFELNEGLIRAESLVSVKTRLGDKYNVVFNFKDNQFAIKQYFNDWQEIELLLKKINNLGWYCACFYSLIKGENVPFNIEELKFYFDSGNKYQILQFESKFDILANRIPDILYHITPTKNVNKILKIGLCPKSRSTASYHPDRVYLSRNFLTLEHILVKSFYKDKKESNWTILKIDTKSIPSYFKIYIDPNFKPSGFFTMNNIPPYVISIYKNIIYNPKNDL